MISRNDTATGGGGGHQLSKFHRFVPVKARVIVLALVAIVVLGLLRSLVVRAGAMQCSI